VTTAHAEPCSHHVETDQRHQYQIDARGLDAAGAIRIRLKDPESVAADRVAWTEPEETHVGAPATVDEMEIQSLAGCRCLKHEYGKIDLTVEWQVDGQAAGSTVRGQSLDTSCNGGLGAPPPSAG
jgi:hypothetical protein